MLKTPEETVDFWFVNIIIQNLICQVMNKSRLLLLLFVLTSLLLTVAGCKKDEKEEVNPKNDTPMKVEIVSPLADTTIQFSNSASFLIKVTPKELQSKVTTNVYVDGNFSYVMTNGSMTYTFIGAKYGVGDHKVKFVVEDQNKNNASIERVVTVFKPIFNIFFNDSVYFKDGIIPVDWKCPNSTIETKGYLDGYSLKLDKSATLQLPLAYSENDLYLSFLTNGGSQFSLTTNLSALPLPVKSEGMGDGWVRRTYMIARGTTVAYLSNNGDAMLFDNFIYKALGRPMFDLFKCDTLASFDHYTILSAKVLSVNGAVTKSGFCWSNTVKTPTYWDNRIELTENMTSYSQKIEPFKLGLTAYVRAYSVNDVGVSYSKVIVLGPVDSRPALLQWKGYPLIRADSMYFSNGVVVDSFASVITERGFCLSKNPEPTINDIKGKSNDHGVSFSVGIGGLEEATYYYARAYAISNGGVSYSDEKRVCTTSVSYPILLTTPVEWVTKTTAYCTGRVSGDGFSPILKQGIVYSTSPNPTLDDYVIYTSTSSASISAKLTGLQGSTKYYYRMFGVNKKYTGYGEEMEFTTGLYDIGEQTQGGWVVYLDKYGLHGFVMAEQDISSTFIWSNDSTHFLTTGGSASGKANTERIVLNTPGENNAAWACYNYSINGYDDWFLPSSEELKLSVAGMRISGLTSGIYWTSTELVVNKAMRYNVQSAIPKLDFKSKRFLVRPFRSI